MLPASASVAATAVPIFVFFAVFSATDRVAVSPSVNTGALFDGVSFKSLTLIVTVMVSVRLPSSVAVIVTV